MSVNLRLSLHRDEVFKKSEIEKNMMLQEISELPEISDGQVCIDAIYSVNWEDKIEIGFYLRNATATTIVINQTPLKLFNPQGEQLTEQVIDLSQMDEIPPYSVRPWKIYFNKEDNLNLTGIISDLKLTFGDLGNQTPYVKVVEDKNPEPLTPEQLNHLGQVLKTLPPVEKDQVSLSLFEMEQIENGSIKVTLIIRQGFAKPASLPRFKIGLLNSNNILVAKAAFEIEPFVLEPEMFFLRTFTFPEYTIFEKDIDLDDLSIVFL
ncbi:SLAP domain-containing protein [Desulforamulus aeronauticus]|uniref:SLAP domain-containing protein n=1 Tax=Desulforamulus aeronauticus DSM 10349 TaxID=1121421 RepID=A0A1M6T3X4_9FIRM|nr:SLAP domain-containing protein [Desulforamulus aeronauticus]SHK51695.1 SLAP domain-containing protein [Desulforamulus aeronauticus DSM 10349]